MLFKNVINKDTVFLVNFEHDFFIFLFCFAASSSGPSLMEVYLEYAPILIAVAVLGFFY